MKEGALNSLRSPDRGEVVTRYSYYRRLSAAQKRIYRQSDELTRVRIPVQEQTPRLVGAVERALETEKCAAVQRALQKLSDALLRSLEVPPVKLKVLAARPSKSWGELQGLYEPIEDGKPGRITLWMRTAQKKQVVAFRTFFRTFLHEIVHHLDYELYELEDSFHTEGFYKRESSIFRQITAPPRGRRKPPKRRHVSPSTPPRPRLTQGELPFLAETRDH